MKKIPSYFFFRIIIVSAIIHALIVLPLAGVVRIEQFSQLVDFSMFTEPDQTVKINLGSGEHEFGAEKFERPKLVSRTLNTVSLWLSFFAVLVLNIPFKLYFYKLKRGKPISDKLREKVRKKIDKMAFLNTIIFFSLPVLTNIIGLIEVSTTPDYASNPSLLAEKQLFGIYIIASILIAFLVFFWQKNRYQFLYIDHIFTADELKQPLPTCQKNSVKKYFLTVNLIMLFLPIVIIVFYITMSITTYSDLQVSELTSEQKDVLLGNFTKTAGLFEKQSSYPYLFFINVDRTYLMIWGLIETMMSSIIYLLFFISWTTRLVIKPIKELLENMRITTKGNFENFATVRSNDEIGQLTTEYNTMSVRLKTYFEEVTDLNKNLEQKVIERTQQIEEQKEEIESQRDNLIDKNAEIEAQKEALLQKNAEIEAQTEEIIVQRDEMAKQKKEITDSINYAQHIQKAVINTENIFPAEQMFILFKPRDIVSGDFYYQKQIGDKKLVAAVDCTGHGVPGAFMSMLGISFLNQITKDEIISPNLILEKLRTNVKHALHQHNSDEVQKDGMDVSLFVVNEKDMTLQFSGANNPLYIVRAEKLKIKNEELNSDKNSPLWGDKEGLLVQLKGDRQPVGAYIREREFTLHKTELQKGDTIYSFSDGFQDQFGGEKKSKYMSKNFKKLLTKISEKSMQEQKKLLNNEFTNWKQNIPQIDDVLVIGVKII